MTVTLDEAKRAVSVAKCADCGGVALAVVYGQPTCGDYCPAGDCDGDCGESRDGCACE